jgi:hypothetical protein
MAIEQCIEHMNQEGPECFAEEDCTVAKHTLQAYGGGATALQLGGGCVLTLQRCPLHCKVLVIRASHSLVMVESSFSDRRKSRFSATCDISVLKVLNELA